MLDLTAAVLMMNVYLDDAVGDAKFAIVECYSFVGM
jgi:hypothetical protein